MARRRRRHLVTFKVRTAAATHLGRGGATFTTLPFVARRREEKRFKSNAHARAVFFSRANHATYCLDQGGSMAKLAADYMTDPDRDPREVANAAEQALAWLSASSIAASEAWNASMFVGFPLFGGKRKQEMGYRGIFVYQKWRDWVDPGIALVRAIAETFSAQAGAAPWDKAHRDAEAQRRATERPLRPPGGQ
jgi:hypothetical protein